MVWSLCCWTVVQAARWRWRGVTCMIHGCTPLLHTPNTAVILTVKLPYNLVPMFSTSKCFAVFTSLSSLMRGVGIWSHSAGESSLGASRRVQSRPAGTTTSSYHTMAQPWIMLQPTPSSKREKNWISHSAACKFFTRSNVLQDDTTTLDSARFVFRRIFQ